MKDPLDIFVQEAFPAEGDVSVDRLQLALRIQSGPTTNRVWYSRLQWCMGLLLVTAVAMGAGVLLERKLLYENGRVVGTATDLGNGSVRLDLSRLPTEGRPLNLEVRDDKGRLIGFQTIGVTTLGNHDPASPRADGTYDSKPIQLDDRAGVDPARSHKPISEKR